LSTNEERKKKKEIFWGGGRGFLGESWWWKCEIGIMCIYEKSGGYNHGKKTENQPPQLKKKEKKRKTNPLLQNQPISPHPTTDHDRFSLLYKLPQPVQTQEEKKKKKRTTEITKSKAKHPAKKYHKTLQTYRCCSPPPPKTAKFGGKIG